MLSVFLPSATKLQRLCFNTCLSFCSERGGGLSACWDTTTPWDQAPPQDQPPPRTRHPQGPDTPGTRHPLDQAPSQDQAPPKPGIPPGAETATAVDGTHPTGMHSCFFKICYLILAKMFSWNLLQFLFFFSLQQSPKWEVNSRFNTSFRWKLFKLFKLLKLKSWSGK